MSKDRELLKALITELEIEINYRHDLIAKLGEYVSCDKDRQAELLFVNEAKDFLSESDIQGRPNGIRVCAYQNRYDDWCLDYDDTPNATLILDAGIESK